MHFYFCTNINVSHNQKALKKYTAVNPKVNNNVGMRYKAGKLEIKFFVNKDRTIMKLLINKERND